MSGNRKWENENVTLMTMYHHIYFIWRVCAFVNSCFFLQASRHRTTFIWEWLKRWTRPPRSTEFHSFRQSVYFVWLPFRLCNHCWEDNLNRQLITGCTSYHFFRVPVFKMNKSASASTKIHYSLSGFVRAVQDTTSNYTANSICVCSCAHTCVRVCVIAVTDATGQVGWVDGYCSFLLSQFLRPFYIHTVSLTMEE